MLPLFGLCVGWPGEAPVARPRVALTSVLHADTYHELTPEAIAADVTAMAPTTRSGDWATVLERYFAAGGTMEEREPALRRALERQGFAWRRGEAGRGGVWPWSVVRGNSERSASAAEGRGHGRPTSAAVAPASSGLPLPVFTP